MAEDDQKSKNVNQEKPSKIKAFHRFDPLAQLVEHLTFNQRARGSSPRRVTKETGIPFWGCLFLL